MKLLFCPKCYDVFKLAYTERSCQCGRVTGRYVDNRNAVTNGNGVSIGIGNGHLMRAVTALSGATSENTREDYYGEGAPTRVLCWVRPNSGPGNPHTKEVSNG